MKTLADRLDEYAEAWRAQPGDKLIGTVLGVDQRTSAFDDTPYPVVTVEVEDGSTENAKPIRPGTEKAWHAYHTVPRNELRKLRPKIGERLGVAYHGKGAKPYERYRVVVDRSRPQINWDEIQGGDTPAENLRGKDGELAADGAGDDDDIPF